VEVEWQVEVVGDCGVKWEYVGRGRMGSTGRGC